VAARVKFHPAAITAELIDEEFISIIHYGGISAGCVCQAVHPNLKTLRTNHVNWRGLHSQHRLEPYSPVLGFCFLL
jgi:hypothetical protein